MITQKCHFIIESINYDHDYKEKVAHLFNPVGLYAIIMPTRHILSVKQINDQLVVTELKEAYLIPRQTVDEKKEEWRKGKG